MSTSKEPKRPESTGKAHLTVTTADPAAEIFVIDGQLNLVDRDSGEAMMIVLKDFGTDWVPVHEVARLVTDRRLYRRKDGHPSRRSLPLDQAR